MAGYPRTNLPTDGSRQDQFAITLSVGGNDYGFWDKKTGGELDSDEVKYYPGATDQSVSLGGRLNPGNVVLQRLYDRVDDHQGNANHNIGKLLLAVGKQQCVITQRPLDPDGNPFGNRIVWNGTLKRVLVPDVDSEGTGAALIEVEITVAGVPASVAP